MPREGKVGDAGQVVKDAGPAPAGAEGVRIQLCLL